MNRYIIIDSWLLAENPKMGILASFNKKADCRNWIMDGLYGTEGAERDHYVDMLFQLDNGAKTIDYRRCG